MKIKKKIFEGYMYRESWKNVKWLSNKGRPFMNLPLLNKKKDFMDDIKLKITIEEL